MQAGAITIPATHSHRGVNTPWTSQGSISGEALFSTVPGMKGDLPQYIITGKVTDNHGYLLLGASFLEDGTIKGVHANFEGNFSLQVADENTILIISYSGFKTKKSRHKEKRN